MSNENIIKKQINNMQLSVEVIEKIYDKYHKDLYRIAYRRINNIENTKDVIQNTMETVCSKIGSEHTIYNLEAWLYTILKYKCYNSFNNYNKVQYYSNDVLENYLVEQEINDIESVDLSIALKSLSEMERKIIICRYIHGFKNSEIAKFCECSDNTVRRKLKKALNILKCKLEE